MRKTIHPEYFEKATITCACGSVLHVGSTVDKVAVEICRACHPFFTGKQKLVDTAGRLERFAKRAEKKMTASSARKGKKVKNAVRASRKKTDEK